MIKLENSLIADEICHILDERIGNIDIDAKKVLEIKSFRILKEIQEIINDEDLSDFEMVEKIVCLFEKHKIDSGSCHDF